MRNLLCLILHTFITSGIFIYYPKIDVIVSSIFFSANKDKFYFKYNIVFIFFSECAYYLMFFLLLYYVTTVVVKFFNQKVFKHESIFILTFFIASIVIIQFFSKYYFGRSRPCNILEFGGSKQFTIACMTSNQCHSNCSFGSFHTSISIMIFISSFQSSDRIKKIIVTFVTFLAIIFSLIRIIQGKHFLSDVVISACITIIIYYCVLHSHNITIIK